MSTRALYTFEGDNSEYHVYKHHDGYPTGALGFIRDALAKAWPLPRFEANEFAAAFVAANKNSAGGVRLTMGKTWGDAASGDIEYHYVITCRDGHLHVAIYHANCWEKPTQSLLASGTRQIWPEKGRTNMRYEGLVLLLGAIFAAVFFALGHM